MTHIDSRIGKPGKHDALARQWAKDYAKHLKVTHGANARKVQRAAVKHTDGMGAGIDRTLEQLAWDRAGSELSGSGAFAVAGSYFDGKPCLGSCGRELVQIDGAWVTKNASGTWRRASKGFCRACYGKVERAGETALV